MTSMGKRKQKKGEGKIKSLFKNIWRYIMI